MTSEPARSTIALAPARWAFLARRASEYFRMSGPAEFVAAAALLALAVLLNLLKVRHQYFDSDELQHLHVIWGWTRGFVQYRDLFDNHMPLFHIMFAPVFGLIGDRATIVYWMRFILLPMSFIAAWSTYEIGTKLFSRRAGIWAVLGVGFFGSYYSVSFQFRTDNLWMPIWLLCISVLVRGAISVRRALLTGLLLGFCLGVSLKATVSLLSLLTSAPLALVLVGREKLAKSWRHLFQFAAAFLAAASLIPAAIMIFFAVKGIWHDFRYCVFDFNFLADRIYENELIYKSHPMRAVILFATALPIIIYVARWISRVTYAPDMAIGRVFIFLVCASYLLALRVFWPPISRSEWPFYPLAFVICSGALLALSEKLARQRWRICQIFRFAPLPALVAVTELFLLIRTQTFWKDNTRRQTDLLRDILRLTEPADYVLDCKGETVFRQRCFRPILEGITIGAIQLGIIVDNSAQRCIETRTCVVSTLMIGRYSASTGEFLERNYLPVTDTLRVAGVILKPSPENPHRFDFEVVIPTSYKIISGDAIVSGTVDETRYDGGRFLAPGRHTFETTSTSNQLVLLWTQAVERHFTPFHRHTSLGSEQPEHD